MSPDRWKQVREVFDAVLDQPAERRAAFLVETTGGDDQLRTEVEDLLRSYNESTQLMAEPAAAAFPELLGAGEAEVAPNRVIGRYRILSYLGGGGMGSVYEAARADQEYEAKVAVKLVKPGMNSGNILQRFLTERQVLANLEHPNIARLLDGGTTDDGLPYLVMEYVQGIPIDRYCDEHKLGIAARIALFRTVCEAVQYAHQRLIVHRDLKPANILVTPEGVPKLLDFGIAKLLDSEGAGRDLGLTAETAPMTPEYASPEQIRGEPVTTASDIYALGVLLYRITTGHSPYRLKQWTAPALFVAIAQTEPERPSDAVARDFEFIGPDGATQQISPATVSATREGVPERLRRRLQGDIDVIILTALRKEPSRRYPSVERFSDDLRRHLEGHPVSARKDTLAYRAGKFVSRHRAGVTAGLTLAVGLVVATITSVYYAAEARREQVIAEQRFQDVRQLARFVLFEFDDAIRQGETAARTVLVAKALDYLDRLSKEAARDPSLQRELISAYLKMGDIQGNLYGPHLGDSRGAVASYQRALEAAESLHSSQPGNRQVALDVGRASVRLGDLVALGGDRGEALRRYSLALRIFEQEASENPGKETEEPLVDLTAKIGFVQYQLGDTRGALASYRRSMELAEHRLKEEARGVSPRKAVAVAAGRIGEILGRTGETDEGLALLERSRATYQELLEENPASASSRRDLAATSVVLGDILAGMERRGAAVESYRKAIGLTEVLVRRDPSNQQYQRDLHIALGRLADVLSALGRMGEARAATEQALRVLKPLVGLPQPNGYDIQQYVWLLVTTPFEDLRDPAAALPYARKAVQMTNASDPATLDVLARALHGAGNAKEAVETEQKALALLPPPRKGEAVSALRKELEDNLERFRRSAAAAQQE